MAKFYVKNKPFCYEYGLKMVSLFVKSNVFLYNMSDFVVNITIQNIFQSDKHFVNYLVASTANLKKKYTLKAKIIKLLTFNNLPFLIL